MKYNGTKSQLISFVKQSPTLHFFGLQILQSIVTANWRKLYSTENVLWQRALNQKNKTPRVLMATGIAGWTNGALIESMLTAALTFRGADVHILLCRDILDTCIITKYPELRIPGKGKKRRIRCDSCKSFGNLQFGCMGLPVHYYEDYVSIEERKKAIQIASEIPLTDIQNYSFNDIKIGEHALAGALRYYARGDLSGEPDGEVVLRKYLNAALLATLSVNNLFKKEQFDVACFHHGIYCPQGLVGEVCRKTGVRVVNWNPAYRKHCFIFSHGDTYHHTMITEPTKTWEQLPWTPELEKRTNEYLKSRWYGANDWIWFHDKPEENLNKIQNEIGADNTRPWITLLTNVMWDAQLHYQSNAFPNMLEWVRQTILYFRNRQDLQLIIRVHPAELRGHLPSRQLLVEEIRKEFPNLPDNVFIVLPESQVSTYALASRSNAVIIYNTKTGIEITSMGVPVIVAGEAWIRNKGFSLDASSPEDYFKILDDLPLAHPLLAYQISSARKYAFHIFFRRMIPLPFVMTEKEHGSTLKLNLPSLDHLLPGKYPGLDVICNGILTGSPFIYPAESEIWGGNLEEN